MLSLIHLSLGILTAAFLAVISKYLAGFIPMGLISPGVFALLLGMGLHPIVKTYLKDFSGLDFTAKKILKFSIILMGPT